MNRHAPIPADDPRPVGAPAYTWAMLGALYGQDIARAAERCFNEQEALCQRWRRRQDKRDLLAALEIQLADRIAEDGPDHIDTQKCQRRVNQLRAAVTRKET